MGEGACGPSVWVQIRLLRKPVTAERESEATMAARADDVAARGLGPSRDFRGYGREPVNPKWPGNARIAINLNLNFEAGGERSILEGDSQSETILTDIGCAAYPGRRYLLVESVFEYGPRVGTWRLLRILKQFDVKATILGVVRALQSCPNAVSAFLEEGHEIASHGYRWIDYNLVDEATERDHLRLAIEGILALTGRKPVGSFLGRSSVNTRRLLVEAGGFLYDRDYLGDELPFWTNVAGHHHLVIPYSLETNDNRFDENSGFSSADDFAHYMIDCFDLLYDEGTEAPKLMSVALHDRLIGRPARAVGLIRFLEHARKHDRVWFCTGRDIAEHWHRVHPPTNEAASP
jgi:peptidoglycan/xylan/chitin deacetylase (PgdA/CDA1 family)